MISFNKTNKIKVNLIGKNFWIQPSIWTASKRKYAARPYKSLLKLLKNEGLLSGNFLFTFNSDENLELFRMCQQLNEIDFFLNTEQREIIADEGFVDHKIKNSKITIRYDKKSLVHLKRGFTPYFSKDWIKQNFRARQNIIIKFTKNGYIKLAD